MPRAQDHGDAATRLLVTEQLDRLAALLHYADVVPEGSQATFEVGLDCGFAGSVVVRVMAAGDCARPAAQPEPQTNGARPG
jgi:hypothetical protein